jgi:hypothetical protein
MTPVPPANEPEMRGATAAGSRSRRESRTAELPSAAVRGGWLVLLGGGAALALSLTLAIALTFGVGASAGSELAVAWNYVWPAAGLGAGAAWLGGFTYDALQSVSGYRFWPAAVRPTYLGVLCGAVCGAFLVGAADQGSIPPSAWSRFPLALSGAFLVTLLAALLISHFGHRRSFAGPAVLLLCLAAAWLAWRAAPRSDVPSRLQERRVDDRLVGSSDFENCSPRPLSQLSVGLLRNSLDGMVVCHSGRIKARLLAFSRDDLLAVYGSQSELRVDGRGEEPAKWCNNRSGAYVDTWIKDRHPSHPIGRLLCFGRRKRGVLQWEDPRDDLFGSIRGAGRRGNYVWWHDHSIGTIWR